MLVHLLLAIDDGANHLLLVGIDVGHLEVEVEDGLAGLSADVHQAFDAHHIRERLADVKVGEADAIDNVGGLQVQVGIVGVAAEDDGAALGKGEVLADDVLDGEPVSALGHAVGTEHVEAALVVVADL